MSRTDSPMIDEVAHEVPPRPTLRILAVLKGGPDGAAEVEDETGELANATAVERGGVFYTYRGTDSKDGRWRRLFTKVAVVHVAALLLALLGCGGIVVEDPNGPTASAPPAPSPMVDPSPVATTPEMPVASLCVQVQDPDWCAHLGPVGLDCPSQGRSSDVPSLCLRAATVDGRTRSCCNRNPVDGSALTCQRAYVGTDNESHHDGDIPEVAVDHYVDPPCKVY